MSDNPQTRYRHRTAEIEAVQWTGDNEPELSTFCSPFDFQTIDPEDRVEDPDQTAAVRESVHGTWQGLAPGDWVVKRGKDFYALSAADFAERYEPAVPVPPTTHAGDRAAVLLWAADFAEEVAEKLRAHHEFERSNGALDVMTELRRLADEKQQQQPDTETREAEAASPNEGPGWYEVINPRNATTNIALVYEDGSLYLPEGDDLTAEEFAFAAAQGNAHRLVRADEVQPPLVIEKPEPWQERAKAAELAVNRVRAALNDCKARGATGMQYEIAVAVALGDRKPVRGAGPLCHESDPVTLRECALKAGHDGDHEDGDRRWPVPGPGRVADEEQGETGDGPRTVCVCGHTKGEHVTVSGQLLCDVCDPDSTSNLVCRGFEAL